MNYKKRPVASAIHSKASTTFVAAAALAAAITMTAGTARAESNFVNGAGTATAHLNFSVVIPKFLYLQVGTGTYPTSLATIDTILFDMTGAIASIGNGSAQTGTGGDLTGGAVTAGAMLDAAGDTLSWSEIIMPTAPSAITVVPAAASVLAHPGTAAAPFADGAATTVSLTPVNKVINQAAKWTYSYKNSTVPAAGTYGATVANKGQVTYTIAMP